MAFPLAAAHDRPPSWKWLRVEGIVQRGEIATTPDWDTDNGFYWITRGVDFLRSYNADPDPVSNNELLLQYADIFAAYRIFCDNNTYLKYELEAMILARVPASEIALNANLTTAAMIAYEELFFDVRDLLNKDTYIRNFVIGKELQKLTKFNLSVIWKLFGYYFGPNVLRAVISRTANPQFVQTPDAVAASLNEDIMGSFKIACAIAAKNPAGGERDNQHLLGLFAKFAEIDKMEDMSANSHQGQVKEHISAMLDNLTFTVGGITPRTGKTSVMYNYRHRPTDPDADQLIEISLTGTSDSFDKSQDLQYPPIPKKTGQK